MIGRQGHEGILCGKIDPGLRDAELFYPPGKIISQGKRADLQIGSAEIAHSGTIFHIVTAYLACRIGIFGIRIGRRPIIHPDIVPPSAHQIEIAVRSIQCADQDATALEDTHGRKVESLVGDTRIEATDKIGIGVQHLPSAPMMALVGTPFAP